MRPKTLSFLVLACTFALAVVTTAAELEIGQRVVTIERCEMNGGDHDPRVVYVAHPGAMNTLERIEGGRVWLRGGTSNGWVDAKAVASLAEGEKIFSSWISQRRNLSNTYYGRGQIHDVMGKHQKAIADLSEAIQLDPTNSRFHLIRGLAYFKQQEWGSADNDFEEAIRLTFQRSDQDSRAIRGNANYHRGLVRFEEHQYEEAIRNFDQAIQWIPTMELAYNRRGMARRLLGYHEQALLDFEKAIGLSPKFSAPRNNRDMTLADVGRYQEAINEYARAIALAPDVIFVIGAVSQDLHSRISKSDTGTPEDYHQLDPHFSIHNNLARLLIDCPDSKLRDVKRARVLVNVLRQRDQGRYFEFVWTEALVLSAEGLQNAAQQTLQIAAAAAPLEMKDKILASLTTTPMPIPE